MSNRPLLVFSKPASEASPRSPGGGGSPNFDDKEGQASRVYNAFKGVLSKFQLDASGDIEKMLVVETKGTVFDFHEAVKKIGLEWLKGIGMAGNETDWKFLNEEEAEKKKTNRILYWVTSNKQVFERFRGLWNKWDNKEELEHGYDPFKKMFEEIRVVRSWNYKDMLHGAGFLETFEKAIEEGETADGKTEIDFEIELHYRTNKADRAKMQRKLIEEIEDKRREYKDKYKDKEYKEGGIAGFICIPDVRFHALKVTLPIVDLRLLVSENDEDKKGLIYLSPTNVKYCRPMAMIEGIFPGDVTEKRDMTFPDCNNKPPVVALLDGVPFLNHNFLNSRVDFDDPDDCSSEYKTDKGKGHGTAMASLICHGDLQANRRLSLSRKIYVRPILVENDGWGAEKIRDDVFLEDIIIRSVKRMFGELDDKPARAEAVRIINLSIGNLRKIFLYEMSSTAKVLDYLSWKYQVLFIISAGNQLKADFDFKGKDKDTENRLPFPMDGKVENDSIIRAVDKRQKEWRIIEPAESINGLTVGAVNKDSFDGNGIGGNYDPLDGTDAVVALYSRLGNGFERQIKPDILVAGGKSHYRLSPNKELKQNKEYPYQGLVSAYPDHSAPEDPKHTKSTIGTSNSTALTTHEAGELYEILEEIRSEHSIFFDEKYNILLIKALLVHGASRADISSIYRVLKNDMNDNKWKAYLSRYCGYGIPDFERVKECTDYRVVTLGCGDIKQKERHNYSLPIPSQCNRSNETKLIVTLAWFSPMVPSHRLLKQAKLSFEVSGAKKPKRLEYDWQQVRKGTLQHEIFQITPEDWNDDEGINISVDCRVAMRKLKKPIPYGLAVTLEVSENIDIYEDIRKAISPAQKVPVQS